jgi:uncharacterized membrane protein
MSRFRPRDWWEAFFTAGIFLKGLDGTLELAGGALLLLLDPARIQHLALRLAQPELSEDPKDFIATHLLHAADTLTGSGALFASLYLLAHGAVKVVLVAALLMNKIWAYPWMIAVLLAFIGYQLYQIAVSPTSGLVALTVFDALIVFLTWREYGRQRTRRTA